LTFLTLLATRVGLTAPLLADALTVAGDVGRGVGGRLVTGLLPLVFALFLAVETRFAARMVARFCPSRRARRVVRHRPTQQPEEAPCMSAS